MYVRLCVSACIHRNIYIICRFGVALDAVSIQQIQSGFVTFFNIYFAIQNILWYAYELGCINNENFGWIPHLCRPCVYLLVCV